MRSEDYVDYLFSKFAMDKKIRADFKRADEDSYEWKVWPVINQFTNLEWSDSRRTFAFVGAAMAKSKQTTNGNEGLGAAFRRIAGVVGAEDFSPRFMRLLSVSDLNELFLVLRPMMPHLLAESNGFDFKRLIRDLLHFKSNSDRIRTMWASEYLNLRIQEDAADE